MSAPDRHHLMARAQGELEDLAQRGFRFAVSLTGEATRAEDLLQDSWFALLKANGPWNAGYLFRTIRNRFVDEFRREARMETVPLEAASDVGEEIAPDFWSGVDLASANGEVEAVMSRLRPEERAVLYLAAVEDYTAQRIGDLLEWPRGTVLSMLHRAREKLRRAAKGDGSTS